MAAKLKDCPFCGWEAAEEVIHDGSDLCRIYCTNPDCGAEISMVKNLFRNRLLWNRRQGTKEAGLTATNTGSPKCAQCKLGSVSYICEYNAEMESPFCHKVRTLRASA